MFLGSRRRIRLNCLRFKSYSKRIWKKNPEPVTRSCRKCSRWHRMAKILILRFPAPSSSDTCSFVLHLYVRVLLTRLFFWQHHIFPTFVSHRHEMSALSQTRHGAERDWTHPVSRPCATDAIFRLRDLRRRPTTTTTCYSTLVITEQWAVIARRVHRSTTTARDRPWRTCDRSLSFVDRRNP